MAKSQVSAEHLRMVDAMVSGGQSLDEIETCFSKKNGGLKGILAAVAQRRAEQSVSTHSNPQPSGAPLDRVETAAHAAGDSEIETMTLG